MHQNDNRLHLFDAMIDFERYNLTLGAAVHIRCEPGWSLDRSWSQRLHDYDLWFVWAGRGSMQLRNHTIELRPGTCVLTRPGGLYLAEQQPDDRLGVSAQHFDLRDPFTADRPSPDQLPPEVVLTTDIPAMRAMMHRIAFLHQQSIRLHHPACDQAAIALMQGLLLDLQCQAEATVQRQSPTELLHQQVVMKLVAGLVEVSQPVPAIADLARKAGYSPAHFSRVFRSVMGVSPQRYLVEQRIARARQLLAETDWSISRIAQSLGYADIFFFSRQFKQITGQPPTQLRNPQARR